MIWLIFSLIFVIYVDCYDQIFFTNCLKKETIPSRLSTFDISNKHVINPNEIYILFNALTLIPNMNQIFISNITAEENGSCSNNDSWIKICHIIENNVLNLLSQNSCDYKADLNKESHLNILDLSLNTLPLSPPQSFSPNDANTEFLFSHIKLFDQIKFLNLSRVRLKQVKSSNISCDEPFHMAEYVDINDILGHYIDAFGNFVSQIAPVFSHQPTDNTYFNDHSIPHKFSVNGINLDELLITQSVYDYFFHGNRSLDKFDSLIRWVDLSGLPFNGVPTPHTSVMKSTLPKFVMTETSTTYLSNKQLRRRRHMQLRFGNWFRGTTSPTPLIIILPKNAEPMVYSINIFPNNDDDDGKIYANNSSANETFTGKLRYSIKIIPTPLSNSLSGPNLLIPPQTHEMTGITKHIGHNVRRRVRKILSADPGNTIASQLLFQPMTTVLSKTPLEYTKGPTFAKSEIFFSKNKGNAISIKVKPQPRVFIKVGYGEQIQLWCRNFYNINNHNFVKTHKDLGNISWSADMISPYWEYVKQSHLSKSSSKFQISPIHIIPREKNYFFINDHKRRTVATTLLKLITESLNKFQHYKQGLHSSEDNFIVAKNPNLNHLNLSNLVDMRRGKIIENYRYNTNEKSDGVVNYWTFTHLGGIYERNPHRLNTNDENYLIRSNVGINSADNSYSVLTIKHMSRAQTGLYTCVLDPSYSLALNTPPQTYVDGKHNGPFIATAEYIVFLGDDYFIQIWKDCVLLALFSILAFTLSAISVVYLIKLIQTAQCIRERTRDKKFGTLARELQKQTFEQIESLRQYYINQLKTFRENFFATLETVNTANTNLSSSASEHIQYLRDKLLTSCMLNNPYNNSNNNNTQNHSYFNSTNNIEVYPKLGSPITTIYPSHSQMCDKNKPSKVCYQTTTQTENSPVSLLAYIPYMDESVPENQNNTKIIDDNNLQHYKDYPTKIIRNSINTIESDVTLLTPLIISSNSPDTNITVIPTNENENFCPIQNSSHTTNMHQNIMFDNPNDPDESWLGRLRDYTSVQIGRMIESYASQVEKLNDFTLNQMERLRQQYKIKAKNLADMIELMNFDNCKMGYTMPPQNTNHVPHCNIKTQKKGKVYMTNKKGQTFKKRKKCTEETTNSIPTLLTPDEKILISFLPPVNSFNKLHNNDYLENMDSHTLDQPSTSTAKQCKPLNTVENNSPFAQSIFYKWSWGSTDPFFQQSHQTLRAIWEKACLNSANLNNVKTTNTENVKLNNNL